MAHHDRQECLFSSVRVGLREHGGPILAGLVVPLEDGTLSAGVCQMDLLLALPGPIEEESGGAAANPRPAADLDVIRPGHRKAVRLGPVGHRPDQEPTTAVEDDRRQLAGLR